ncbi:hypothetical protein ACQ86N_27390 [Puia sp. P3]|uniref:hypothetical protein n=1 Tax=Puia sp. P3 TaxID=3423952 RepID=UPI003D67EA31
MSRILPLIIVLSLFLTTWSRAQLLTPEKAVYTHTDSLRGSITPERAWWDLLKYDLTVIPSFNEKSLSGDNGITFKALSDGQTMQIDLQEPMNIKAITWGKKSLTFTREGNAFHVKFPKIIKAGSTETIRISWSGIPKVAVRPPWGGGWIWNLDEKGRPWMTVACEGLGASALVPLQGPPQRRTRLRRHHAHRRTRHPGRDRQRPPQRQKTQRQRHHHLDLVRHQPDQFI